MSLEGKTVFKTDIATGTDGDRQGAIGHATIHNNVGFVLNNLQDDVGIDNSTDTDSLKYKVANVDNLKAKSVETPSVDGSFARYNSSGDNIDWTIPSGAGDVVGPSSSTDENIPIFNSTSGKILKDSGVNISAVTANTAKLTANTTNVTAAGALMDSELTSIADVKALDQSVVSGATPTFGNDNFTEATNKNYVTDAQLVVIGNTSGTNTGDEVAADLTTAGIIEIATAAETTTGTDATRSVSPDGLAGSDYGKRVVGIQVIDVDTDTETGDDKAFFRVPSVMNGWNLVGVAMNVATAGTTGTTDVQIHNVTQAADMLSTVLTIDSTETDSSTAATPAVIDTDEDDVTTGDRIRIDIDAVSTTAAKGLYVEMIFQLP